MRGVWARILYCSIELYDHGDKTITLDDIEKLANKILCSCDENPLSLSDTHPGSWTALQPVLRGDVCIIRVLAQYLHALFD